jgi:hypothetical protein
MGWNDRTNITWGELGRRWKRPLTDIVQGRFGAAAGDVGKNLYWMGKEVYDTARRPSMRRPSKRRRVSSSSGGSIPYRIYPPMSISSMRLQRLGSTSSYHPTLSTRTSSRSSRRSSSVGGYRRFNTTGNFVGRFKKVQRVYHSRFAKYGFKMRSEKGGTVSQDKCVYIGHSTGARAKLVKTFWSALLRKLMLLAGQQICTFKEVVSPEVTVKPGTIRIDYSTLEDGTTESSITVNMNVGDTYEELASTMATNWNTAVAASDYTLRIHRVRYIPQADETSGADSHEFKLDCTRATFTFRVTSNMKIQNRTLAATGAGDGEHQHHMNSVENNPLQGKSYYKLGGGFRFKWSNDASNTFTLHPDDSSGLIEGDPDDATLSTEMQDLLQRPPATTSFWNCKHGGNVKLGPGTIKSSNLSYSKTLSVNAFLKALHSENESASKHTFPYAKCKMFALEKMMHTDDADEPDMNIGYEINNFYQGVIRTRLPSILVDKDVL